MFPSHLRVMHIIRTENLFECTLQFIKSCMLPFVEHYTRYIIWIIWFDVDQLHLPANDLFSTAMAHDVRRIWICLHSNVFAWWKKNLAFCGSLSHCEYVEYLPLTGNSIKFTAITLCLTTLSAIVRLFAMYQIANTTTIRLESCITSAMYLRTLNGTVCVTQNHHSIELHSYTHEYL